MKQQQFLYVAHRILPALIMIGLTYYAFSTIGGLLVRGLFSFFVKHQPIKEVKPLNV